MTSFQDSVPQNDGRLFLIATEVDYRTFESFIQKDSIVFAWTQEAAHFFESQKIPYSNLMDFLNEDFNTDFIYQKYSCLTDFIDSVEKWMQEKFDVPHLYSFRSQVHSVRLPFFLCTYEIDKLCYLLKKLSIREIFCSSRIGDAPVAALVPYLDNRIKVHEIQGPPNASRTPNWYSQNKPLKILIKKLLGRSHYKPWRSILSSFLNCRLFFNKKPFALVHSVDWNHDEVLKNLQSQYNILFFEDFIWKSRPQKNPVLPDVLQKLDELMSLLPDYNGIPTYLFMKNEISAFLRKDFPRIEGIKTFYQKADRKFQFHFLFTSYYLIETEVVHFYMKQRERPTFFTLHGGTSGFIQGSGFTPFSARKGSDQTCHFLIYSDLVKADVEHVKSKLLAPNCQIGIVGDIYFQNLIRRNVMPTKNPTRGQKLKICYIYAGTGKYNALFKWGIMDDASLTGFRYQLLKTVETFIHPDVEFTFKFGYEIESSGYPLEKSIMSSDKIKYLGSNKRLLNHVQDFDLFITELPSTSLLELMALNKKVICLLDQKSVTVCSKANPDFENALIACKSIPSFLETIKDVISLRTEPTELGNRPVEFAKMSIDFEKIPDAAIACTDYIKNHSSF